MWVWIRCQLGDPRVEINKPSATKELLIVPHAHGLF